MYISSIVDNFIFVCIELFMNIINKFICEKKKKIFLFVFISFLFTLLLNLISFYYF